MSGAPIIKGTNQLPKPPIIAGMTMKKIMMTAWLVKNTLYMFFAASTEPSPVMTAEISGKTWMPGDHQLGANRDRQQRPEHAAADGEDQIERADVLVVGRKQIAPPSGRHVVFMPVMRVGLVVRVIVTDAMSL